MPKQKILIAEDSKSMQMFYSHAIPDVLYEKQIVPDGEAALTAYKATKPDIILLDMNMPIINGYQVLKAIRANLKDRQTTIIMVTSTSEKNDVVACAQLGIQGYIVKPFKPEELVQAITKYHNANLKAKKA